MLYRTIRKALAEKYSINNKLLKNFEPFGVALEAVITELNQKENEKIESEEKVKEKEKSKKKKNKKKDKKKSRKRKREEAMNDDDDDDDDAEEDKIDGFDEELPKKKRKTNDGKEAVTESKRKKKTKSTKKPYEYSLTKLRKLLRATHLATPKIYSQLKGKSNKKQVDILKSILTENDVPINNLSDQQIKKIQQEYDLKREMKELGLDINDQQNDFSTKRPKRIRKKIKYNDNYGEEKDGEQQEETDKVDEDGDSDQDEEEEQYQPSSDGDSEYCQDENDDDDEYYDD